MQLMTEEIAKQLPELCAQDDKGDDAIAYVKYFDTFSGWTWYVTEYDPINKEFFGLVIGPYKELGYFTLDQLENIKTIERDLYFKPTTIGEIKKEIRTIWRTL